MGKLFDFAFIMAILVLSSCQSTKGIRITGEDFPDISGSQLFIASEELKLPFRKGKFKLSFDSLKEGRFAIAIQYPIKSDSLYSRDKFGKRTSRYVKSVGPSILKYLYINPDQSKEYIISPWKEISKNSIYNFSPQLDYLRTDIYRAKVISKSKDAQLFEQFDSLSAYYEKYCRYKILDSLYKASKRADKIYSDFLTESLELNKIYNYPAYMESKKEIIRKHLDNPVSVLQILNISKEDFLKDPEYSQLFSSVSGRALQSQYYQQAKLKFDLQNRDSVLDVGKTFTTPVGVGPEDKKLVYDFSKYSYTLVEFWASWCVPCRKKNPKWNEVLSKYKSQKFQILGVSLDERINQWRAAIDKDKLIDWVHISDLQNGFNGINALKYGINAIPANVLIDANGYIVKKDIEPDELSRFLEDHNK